MFMGFGLPMRLLVSRSQVAQILSLNPFQNAFNIIFDLVLQFEPKLLRGLNLLITNLLGVSRGVFIAIHPSFCNKRDFHSFILP